MKSPCQLMIVAGCALTVPATHFKVETVHYITDEGAQRDERTNQPAGLASSQAPRLSIGKNVFASGETPTYNIQGASPNTPIYWSSWKDGVSTGEVDNNYGETTDDSGNWSSSTGPWSAADGGIWIKQANVNGVNVQVQFQVLSSGTGPDYPTSVNNQQLNSPTLATLWQ